MRGGSFAGKARGLKKKANLTMFFFLLSCCCWLVVRLSGIRRRKWSAHKRSRVNSGRSTFAINLHPPNAACGRQRDRETERKREREKQVFPLLPPSPQPASRSVVDKDPSPLPLFFSQACFPTTHDEIQFPRSAGSHDTGSSRRHHATLLLAEA